MKLEQYMIERKRTAGHHSNLSSEMLNMVLGLCGETGEVADLVKKFIFHEHSPVQTVEKLENEIGDVCWYLFGLIDALGLDFEEILQKNVDKLRARYPEGFDSQRSINRGENE